MAIYRFDFYGQKASISVFKQAISSACLVISVYDPLSRRQKNNLKLIESVYPVYPYQFEDFETQNLLSYNESPPGMCII